MVPRSRCIVLSGFLTLSFIFLICFGCCNIEKGTFLIKNNDLRIGSPGDYPPLSMYDRIKGRFSGKDIELIEKFGKNKRKKIIFIKTTWKSLSDDMLAGKFDIAIGGISISEKRKQLFIFSVPLLIDRKVALFRKKDSLKYTHFYNMDTPNTIIVENKGGTNEIFAEKNIHHACLKVVSKNEETLELLLAHKADIMFTDETEAQFRIKNNPELSWRPLDEKISPPFEKAFMFNKRDTLLKSQFDNWIKCSTYHDPFQKS
ncbi:transporter substrate-binding domain-containing protein [Chryseobacterium sp.]|uniref:transporter substrate-binding domain-containing protein n=1 Tax=Chryseobacterium sp. TaxID=1871047 RepID=UPI0025C50878|nr:transporter substrate-binding domain-containing protein [Chryseobacterium sp.]MBV8325153.1 transporter substrate-binding domain-containing protein [Chryseobacterium sp.]